METSTVKKAFLSVFLLILLIPGVAVATSGSQSSADSYGQTGETVRTGGPVPSEGSAQTGSTAQPQPGDVPAQSVDAGPPQSPAGASAEQTTQNAETIYEKACAICHESGVAQAPRIHDQQAWQARIDAELATVKQEKPDLSPEQQQDEAINRLVGSVKSGKGAMPAGGMCEKCSDAEYKAAIKYMMAPGKEQGAQPKAGEKQ